MTNKVLIRAPQAPERRAAARMTGRYLVTLQPQAGREITAKLKDVGFKTVGPLEPNSVSTKALLSGSNLTLHHVGVSLVDPKPEQEDALHSLAAEERGILALEPERIVRAVEPEIGTDYVRGWRDAVDALAGRLLEETPPLPSATREMAAMLAATWGLTATKAVESKFTGTNIKVAILDTGFDLSHSDFAHRPVTTQNFVGDRAPFHDGVGHGTHCTGTIAGPRHPLGGPRYGIAYEGVLFEGRVLDDNGTGGDFNVLEGIDWAIDQGCAVISLSLGAPWLPGDPPFSQAYETAAQRALAAGCLLIVAAGNEAGDSRFVGAVGTPGNSPSVLTVAAIDRNSATASFSNRLQPDAPGVKGPDLAAPGVEIYSAWPEANGRYNTISGTSMATPHVAGICALFAEANPDLRGEALKEMILAQCAPLANGKERQGEIGRGLVQAPSAAVDASGRSKRSKREPADA